jgi:mono/diheme cytochrome c family protein
MRVLTLVAALSLSLAANAQVPTGDVASGAAIAERWCTSCHAVGPGAGRATDGAPTLQSVADRASTTVTSLTVFLRTPHDRMPDLSLTREETEDLIAYILSLRRR